LTQKLATDDIMTILKQN